MAAVRCALALTGVLAGHGVAAAEPCQVEIVAAPSVVRDQIEAWVRLEPSCTRRLHVSVTEGDDGYTLHARDDSGRVRERVVPDADVVGTLVVAWMADDSPTLPPVALDAQRAPDGDNALATQVAESLIVHEDGGTTHAGRRFAVGVLAGRRGGVRGQVDLLARGRWTLGVAGAVRRNNTPDDRMTLADRQGAAGARLTAATRRTLGGVELRAHLGIGVDAEQSPTVDPDTRDGKLVAKAEAGLFASVHVGRRWVLVGGPLADHSLADGGRGNVALFLGVGRAR